MCVNENNENSLEIQQNEQNCFLIKFVIKTSLYCEIFERSNRIGMPKSYKYSKVQRRSYTLWLTAIAGMNNVRNITAIKPCPTMTTILLVSFMIFFSLCHEKFSSCFCFSHRFSVSLLLDRRRDMVVQSFIQMRK